jgi:adenylyl-sulfate kinase
LIEAAIPDCPVCWWLTGYQGAGKTTLAYALARELASQGRPSEIIDGDAFRASHDPLLGYSREARNLNVRRIADYAMTEMDRGVDVIVAAMSPFRESRDYALRAASSKGLFLEVHVSTPLTVCKSRDTKGLYAAFERGEASDLPGLDLPYEPPLRAAAVVSMVNVDPRRAAERVIAAAQGEMRSQDLVQ